MFNIARERVQSLAVLDPASLALYTVTALVVGSSIIYITYDPLVDTAGDYLGSTP
jgi:hypothetical protein